MIEWRSSSSFFLAVSQLRERDMRPPRRRVGVWGEITVVWRRVPEVGSVINTDSFWIVLERMKAYLVLM